MPFVIRKEVIPLIKTVAFDFDHTLYDRWQSFENLAPEFCSFFAGYLKPDITPHQVAAAIINADRATFEKKRTFKDDTLTADIKKPWLSIYRSTAASGIFETAPEYEMFFYDFMLKVFPTSIAMYPDAIPAIRQLRQEGYLTALLTNGTSPFQIAKLEAKDIYKEFDAVLLCGDMVYQKPHPSTFEALCSKLGCAPEETLYVGDNPYNDVEGARRAGLTPVWMRSVGIWPQELSPAPYAIDAIGQLVELVKTINKG